MNQGIRKPEAWDNRYPKVPDGKQFGYFACSPSRLSTYFAIFSASACEMLA
jgi:hypothetical protein